MRVVGRWPENTNWGGDSQIQIGAVGQGWGRETQMPGIFHEVFVVKGAATDMRYFTRSKFFRSLVHKKSFSLIRKVAFNLGCVFSQERQDTSSEFEWTRRKVAIDNNSQ